MDDDWVIVDDWGMQPIMEGEQRYRHGDVDWEFYAHLGMQPIVEGEERPEPSPSPARDFDPDDLEEID